jgi:hypothetical protein
VTAEDLKRNTELRDQFNPARLKIGMTDEEVETVLKAMALQTATRDGVPYKIYGSDEKFNIEGWLHYSNIWIVFKDGKVSFIHGH